MALFHRALLAACVAVLLGGFSHTIVYAESSSDQEDLEIGLTLFEIGQYERAAGYLQKVSASNPKSLSAGIPLGISLFKLGRHAEAIAVLEPLAMSGSAGADGSFFLAESYKALGRNAEARRAYRKSAEQGGPLSTRSLLESARLAGTLGDLDGAKSDFERVLELQTAGEMVDEAKAGLADIERRRNKRLSLNIDMGTRYDSNVRLEHTARKSGGAGVRGVMNAQARYRLVNLKSFRSETALSINQGRYADQQLRLFDLGVHQLSLDGVYRFRRIPMRAGLLIDGAWNALDMRFYNRSLGGGPTVMIAEGAHFATGLTWHWRRDIYSFDARNGVNRRSQLTQYAFWGKNGYAGLGGTYEQNRAIAPEFIYDILSMRAFAGDQLVWGVSGDWGLDYALTPYLRAQNRQDRTITLSAGLSRYWGIFGVRFSGAYVRNQSENAPEGSDLNFNKQIYGLDFRLRL